MQLRLDHFQTSAVLLVRMDTGKVSVSGPTNCKLQYSCRTAPQLAVLVFDAGSATAGRGFEEGFAETGGTEG